MPRVIWKGAVSFSLIRIPVALHAASREQSLSFDMLDRRDYAPIGYQRINKGSGKPVELADIVKGYEYEKGGYVAEVIDLGELLKRSLAERKGSSARRAPPAAASRPRGRSAGTRRRRA